MSVPSIAVVQLAGSAEKPLVVVGPSIGTSVTALWGDCAALLADDLYVVGWELPGHGRGARPGGPFTMAELAAGVLDAVTRVQEERGATAPFMYAGDSVGGAVGLQLLLDAPDRVGAAVLACTGAKIGEAEAWRERAATIREAGTASWVETSAQRWFGPGFVERAPEEASALLNALTDADDEGYAAVCEALAGFDVRDRLGEITAPVVAVAGAVDQATPTALLAALADGIAGATLVELDGVAHLAPVEAPRAVASLIRSLVRRGHAGRSEAAMAVRREVLGDDHVDRAVAGTTDMTRDFQDFITQYAWGGIWTRPGLDRRSRSVAVLTALVAGRHFEELEFHLRAALRNGLTREEIVEVLLQSAVYIGVPAANSAFAIAQRVLAED